MKLKFYEVDGEYIKYLKEISVYKLGNNENTRKNIISVILKN